MIYREYGQTGKKVSLLGFGGMRFKNIENHDECVNLMVAAAEGGVNYFDTAPGYFGLQSEEVFGKGFAEMRKRNLPYFCATKTFESSESGVRRQIDEQLKRMDIEAIDFYHVWCVSNLDSWKNRKEQGVLQAFRKLKEEGLIKHICVSSHLARNEIKQLLIEEEFEGVLFGYSASNFQTRQNAFDAIKEKKLGAVVMNPLSGGVIPEHPELFGFMCKDGENVSSAALRFLWDHPEITSTLVGFDTIEHLNDSLSAMKSYEPRTPFELETVKAKAPASMEGICTGCAYCDKCPQGIPILSFMDAYNQKLFNPNDENAIANRLKWHWSLEKSGAAKCTECGLCEEACTQHLDIVKRLKEIAG